MAISCSKREGLPLNIVEAMLSGTPIVASMNRGHKELIREGENGFIVKVNDSDDMARKILTLFSDKKIYDEISESALRCAKSIL